MEEKEKERVLARIREAEQWRDSRYAQLWEDCYRRYRSQALPRREGSNIFVPHTFMQCEVIKARITESLFASRPYVAALPREGSDQARAEKMQLLLDWQLNDRMDLPRVIGSQVLDSMIIYGTGIAYTGWELRTGQRRRSRWQEQPLYDAQGRPLLDEQGQRIALPQQQVEKQVELLYDDPLVAHIPLQDFFCDARAWDIRRARFCGHREYVTRSLLEDMERQGKWQIDWQRLERQTLDLPMFEAEDSFAQRDSKGLYLLHHYWEDERHLVFVNRSQCVCAEDNPFWHGLKPYDKCCYVELPGEFYGMGVPEILSGLQDELNTSRNQRIDYNSLSLRRMWKLRKGCGLSARDLIWRQNGVLQVENMDDVQEISLQGLPADAFANESGVKQDMQDVTGCHDILMGIAYSQETATTTMTRDNNASLRFKAAVRAVVKDLLLPIARKCVALDQQFLSEPRLLRLLNQPDSGLFDCDPRELSGDYDLIYCGAATDSLANRELNKERVLQAYSLALSDPAYQRDDAARLRLFRKVLAALNITDGDELLPQTAVPAEPASAGIQPQTAVGAEPGALPDLSALLRNLS